MKKLLSGILASSLILSMATSALATSQVVTAEGMQYTQTLASINLGSKYAKIGSFNDGLAVVTTAEGYQGVIDTNGNEIVAPTYGKISAYSQGFATFMSANLTGCVDYNEGNDDETAFYGFLNTSGEEVYVEETFSGNIRAGFSSFNGGYATEFQTIFSYNENGQLMGASEYIYSIDLNGTKSLLNIETSFGYSSVFSDEGLIWAFNDGLLYFLNGLGEVVLETNYDSVSSKGFQGGLCAVRNMDGAWGFINTEGEEVIPCQYRGSWNCFEDKVAVDLDDGNITFLDKAGATLFAVEATGYYGFYEGYAILNNNGSHFLIDSQGNELLKGNYTNSINMKDGYVGFAMGELLYDENGSYQGYDGKFALYDGHGTEVVPMIYDDLTVIDSTKFLAELDGVFTIHYFSEVESIPDDFTTQEDESTPEESTSPTYSSWAEPQVTFAEENNLIVDSLGNDYTKSITREQIADLLVNMMEQYTGSTMLDASADTFTDSTSIAVLKAYEAGIISGKGEGLFDPEATATRQEIAIMIVNAIKVLEENTGESFVDHSLTSLEGFSDFDTTADWAQNHVAILANNGIMAGSDGYLTPLSETSIQECLVLNNNLFNLS